MRETAVHVYGLVQSERRPRVSGAPEGLPGTGAVRLIDAQDGLWLVAADAPLRRYGSEAIERGLEDLDWVSQCAVAHERVLRHFARKVTTLPMRLFTLFHSDDRAVAHVRAEKARLSRALKRIAGCEEWGVRVAAAPVAEAASARRLSGADAGRRFLEGKRAQHRAAREIAASGPAAARSLVRKIVGHSRAHKTIPVPAGNKIALLADVALLVPRDRRESFRRAVDEAASAAPARGLQLTLSGPWPAYNFVGARR